MRTVFCFAVLCCGYTLTDFPISIRLTSLALWQSNDCPSASKATLMNIYRYFMWIHYVRLHNHNKAKHNKTVCIFLGIYCTMLSWIYIPGKFIVNVVDTCIHTSCIPCHLPLHNHMCLGEIFDIMLISAFRLKIRHSDWFRRMRKVPNNFWHCFTRMNGIIVYIIKVYVEYRVLIS